MSKNPFNTLDETTENQPKFDNDNETYMKMITVSVRDKANYSLRQIIGATQRLREKVATERKDEYGAMIEDWNKVSTNDLINFLMEGSAWSFCSTPLKMQSFIESSLAEIVYKDEYNKIFTDPELTGSVAIKEAVAESSTQESQFALTFRKVYTKYLTEMLTTFDLLLKRVEHIVDMRQREERANPNNPFKNRNDN